MYMKTPFFVKVKTTPFGADGEPMQHPYIGSTPRSNIGKTGALLVLGILPLPFSSTSDCDLQYYFY